MENNIIKNINLEQYNKKFRNRNYRLLKCTKKEVENFDKLANKSVNTKNYLLEGRKWALIGDTYYEIPRPIRFTWFRNLNAGIQTGVCLLGAGVLASAVAVPLVIFNKPGSDDASIPDIEIDDETSKLVKVESKKILSNGDLEITLKPKEGSVITDIEKLSIGNQELEKNKDYSLKDNVVTIKKEIIVKHKNEKVIIKPTIKDKENDVINVWTYENETLNLAESGGILDKVDSKYYLKSTGSEVRFTVISSSEYVNAVKDHLNDPTVKTEDKIDVLLFEDGMSPADIRNTKYAYDLSESNVYDYSNLIADMYPATVAYGQVDETDEKANVSTHQIGLSYDYDPCLMVYRRSLAKKYFGTDNPTEVKKYFADDATMIESAKVLKAKSSGGCCKLVVGLNDLTQTLTGSQSTSFLNENLKYIGMPSLYKSFAEISKEMSDNELIAGYGQWTDEWFQGMKGVLENTEIFSYILPGWGIDYVLKTNAPETSGDWAAITPTNPCYWGGTTVGISKETDNQKTAGRFIHDLVCYDTLKASKKFDSFDSLPNSLKLYKEIADQHSDVFLGGQNIAPLMNDVTLAYKGSYSNRNKYENTLFKNGKDFEGNQWDWLYQVNEYVAGNKTYAAAVDDFVTGAKSTLPEIFK